MKLSVIVTVPESGDERTGPTSYARTSECARLMIGFECTVA